jgi:hypothetical protein
MMNASSRLSHARKLVEEGLYEQALIEYIWFYEHALEENSALYGVRLSFALGYWRELGDIYSPAMIKLKQVVESKSQELENGNTDRALFHDVVAINNVLDSDDATYRLFVSLNKKNPDFAQSCARMATEVLVKAKDFELARSFIKNPIEAIENLTSSLNEDTQWARRDENVKHSDAIMDGLIHNFIHDVCLLVNIVGSAGELALSQKMFDIAVSEIRDPEVRSVVENGLVGVSPAP